MPPRARQQPEDGTLLKRMTETESGDLYQKNDVHLRALDRAEGRYTATAHRIGLDEPPAIENAYEPDIADEIDSLPERIAEHFHVSIPTAKAFLAWHASQVERITMERLMGVLAQVKGVITYQCENTCARAWGLAFALGMAHRNNGVRDMTHIARKLNCTVALISHYKRFWDGLLPPDVRIYGKTAQACVKYRIARLISYGYRTRTTDEQHANTANGSP